MIYKMENGRPIECRIAIDGTKDVLQFEEMVPLGALTVWKNPLTGQTVFRALLLSRQFTIVADTVLDIAEAIRYLRLLGFLGNKNEL